jgi:hypothetical protein
VLVLGKGKSTLSCLQMEHYGAEINDKSIRLPGGKQRIVMDGYQIPLTFRNGLAYLKCCPPTDAEVDLLPHLTMTARSWSRSGSCHAACTLRVLERYSYVQFGLIAPIAGACNGDDCPYVRRDAQPMLSHRDLCVFTTTVVVGRLIGGCSTARVVAAVIIIIVVVVVRTGKRYIAGNRDIHE